MENIVNLILSNPKQAAAAVVDSLKERAFDLLDNYTPPAIPDSTNGIE